MIAFVRNDEEVNLYWQEDFDSITGKITESIGWSTDPKSKTYEIVTLKKDLETGASFRRQLGKSSNLRTGRYRNE